MAGIGDGFKNIFLAGIGAAALTADAAKEVVDKMIAKGELTVEQGKSINEELKRKASESTTSVRDTALEARMSMMSAEERAAFAAKAAELAAKLDAKEAEKAAAEAPVEVEAEVVDEEPEAPAAE